MVGAKAGRVVKNKAAALGLLVAVLVATGLLAVTDRLAHAALPNPPFTVNSTADRADADLGDPVCDAVLGVPGNQCTLRAAIQEANATPRADTINFKVGGTGVKTIKPASPLPTITDRVIIDGYTQPGATENTNATGVINANLLIELNGANAGNTSGLLFAKGSGGTTSSGSVVRGLVINRFQIDGIAFTEGPGSRAEGNFIGTDPSGQSDLGNGSSGVEVGGGTVVGGTTPEARNLISGNGGEGVAIVGRSDNSVRGNLIGTGKDGATDLGNDGDGVEVLSGARNLLADNRIAFNGEGGSFDGVLIRGGGTIANRVLSNEIFANAGLGIDLEGGTENASGATANDPQDPDAGPNNLQNKPVVTSATGSGGTLTVRGNLNSTPGRTFTVQFFSNPSGNEGKRFLAHRAITTDANGNAPFSFGLPVNVPAGHFVTATATGAGNTSEFSAPRTVLAQ
jgi:CSLREA domain-containing protein